MMILLNWLDNISGESLQLNPVKKNDWVFCYMTIQKNYEELKKKSEITEKFIRLADQLEIDDKDVPKTEKGMNTKVKELMDRLNKKLEKEEKKKG